jgi:hypothetical protein
MTCEVLVGRHQARRCAEPAKLYRVEWGEQSLGEYELCPGHCSAASQKPVKVIRLDGRTRRPKRYDAPERKTA